MTELAQLNTAERARYSRVFCLNLLLRLRCYWRVLPVELCCVVESERGALVLGLESPAVNREACFVLVEAHRCACSKRGMSPSQLLLCSQNQ